MKNTKKIITICSILAGIAVLTWVVIIRYRGVGIERTPSFSELMAEVQNDKVLSATISGQRVEGHYKNSPDTFRTVIPSNYSDFYRISQEHQVRLTVEQPGTNYLEWAARGIGPFLQIIALILLILIALWIKNGPPLPDKSFISTTPGPMTFQSLAGMEKVKKDLQVLVDYLRAPSPFHDRKITCPKTLLIGPSGVGKTLLAQAVAKEAGRRIYLISASTLISEMSSARVIQKTFQDAKKNAPAVILIDRLDKCSIGQGLTSYDPGAIFLHEIIYQLESLGSETRVVVIGTASNSFSIPPDLVGPNRFDRRIEISLPDREERRAILDLHFKSLGKSVSHAADVNIDQIVEQTNGFSGAELALVTKEASLSALLEKRVEIRQADLLNAAAALNRQRAATANQISFIAARASLHTADSSQLSFADVGGLESAKDTLGDIISFLRDPAQFARFGAAIPRGVLLVGPPGTGKTLIAKAMAAQAGCAFFSMSGSAFIELFVGVGAGRIRDLFDRARKSAPCLVFIDELDALARKRSSADLPGNREQDHALNELLTQLDGFSPRSGVVVLAATNRADALDPAVVRAGRFDRQITVTLPDQRARAEILKIHLRQKRASGIVAADVDEVELAEQTENLSGADLAAIVNQAAIRAVRRNQDEITMRDFEDSIGEIIPGKHRLAQLDEVIEKSIIRQSAAKAAVIGVTRSHYSRITSRGNMTTERAGGKDCLLLIGPKGTGKTAIVQKVAAHLGVPFFSCQMSTLAARAEANGSPPSQAILRGLLEAADGQVLRAEHGIVCFQGLERLLELSGSTGIQEALAQFIRGVHIDVPINSVPLNAEIKKLRTERILFFIEANLPDIEAAIRRRYKGRSYVTMKRLESDEKLDLVNFGFSDDLLNTISMVAISDPLNEFDLELLLTDHADEGSLENLQKLLDKRGVQTSLREYLPQIVKKIQDRGENGAAVPAVLRDIYVDLLCRQPGQDQQAIVEILGGTEPSQEADVLYQGLDPAIILSELPPDLGAITAQELSQRQRTVILIEQPAGKPLNETTANAALNWISNRSIPCVKAIAEPSEGAISELIELKLIKENQIEKIAQALVQASAINPPASFQAVNCLELVINAIESGGIDRLRGLVLLRGIVSRLGYTKLPLMRAAEFHLIQAYRSFDLLKLVQLVYELNAGSDDAVGRSTRVAGAATVLSDGLAELEGEGMLAIEGRAANRDVESQRVKEALRVTPHLNHAICDAVARLRESLGLPIKNLDGMSARSEWAACRIQLQRQGDIRNTRNLMLLLAAVDSCLKALSVITEKELWNITNTVYENIFGREDRVQERLHYWKKQMQGLSKLLSGEKRRENLLLWQNCEFDLDRMSVELAPILSNTGFEQTCTSDDLDPNLVLDVLDQHYSALRQEAISLCEKHLGNSESKERQVVAFLVDEFDSEVIMQHCAKNQISYLTILPAST